MKKSGFIILILFTVLAAAVSADARSLWYDAVEYEDQDKEKFNDGMDLIYYIEKFKFTNVQDLNRCLKESERLLEKSEQAISLFKKSKSSYSSAIRKWTYFLDHHYEESQKNRNGAKENRKNDRKNIEACNKNIEWVNNKKDFFQGCYDECYGKLNQ